MAQISMYVTNWCPYCQQAKRLLESIGATWNEINIELEGLSRPQLAKITGGHTVPQIVIDGKTIGGYTDLYGLYHSGKLLTMLDLESSAESDS